MDKDFIEQRYKIDDAPIPFFREKVIPVLEKIPDIDAPWLFFSSGHELVELEYEKSLNDHESNLVSIDFYENEAEIYFIKRREGITREQIPMDIVTLEYDKVPEYVDTVCRNFINDATGELYKVERPKEREMKNGQGIE